MSGLLRNILLYAIKTLTNGASTAHAKCVIKISRAMRNEKLINEIEH